MHSDGKRLLKENRKIYELYQKLLLDNRNLWDIQLMEGIKAIAQFAANTHVGLFSDRRLEDPLLRIAIDLEQKLNIPKVSLEHSKPLLVHIATTLYPVGGHIRFIERIITYEKEFTHHLLVTEQGEVPYSKHTIEKIKAAGGEVIFLDQPDMLQKAAFIRSYVNDAVFVYLHIHPHDPIPVVALGVKQLPAVCFINHADHAFWLGVSVSDIVADIRYSSQEITLTRRGANASLLLPLPIDNPDLSMSKEEARIQLGYEKEEVLILSMGSYYKFLPAGAYSFFPVMVRVLEEIPDARLLVIGISEDMDLEKVGYIPHPQIELLGVEEKPGKYQRAVDIVVDPIPYGSYTSLLESCAFGAYPVVYRNIIPIMTLAEDPALKEYIKASKKTDEFIETILNVIKDKTYNSTAAIQQSVLSFHHGEDWVKHYNDLKDKLSNVNHRISKFGQSKAELTDENDINLAVLNRNRREKEIYILLQNMENLAINWKSGRLISFFQLMLYLTNSYGPFLRLKIIGRNFVNLFKSGKK